MILIGQYDSPFVRRVAVAMATYGMAFTHRPWSVFGDAEALAGVNPLMRVPVLVLADGTALIESHLILDYLDGLVEMPLFPRSGPERHLALRQAALATGMADKAVSLFYEGRLHREVSPVWAARCEAQVIGTARVIEAELSARPGPFWAGDAAGHADFAAACALRFVTEVHPGLLDPETIPRLAAMATRLEATQIFRAHSQPFAAPA